MASNGRGSAAGNRRGTLDPGSRARKDRREARSEEPAGCTEVQEVGAGSDRAYAVTPDCIAKPTTARTVHLHLSLSMSLAWLVPLSTVCRGLSTIERLIW
jgi:hypothetical protein